MATSAQKRAQAPAAASEKQTNASAPITLSERSMIGLALIRLFVGYLWFQQLFWKFPPTFAGLHHYITEEIHSAIIPSYGALLQHTFVPYFVPLAAAVWIAELVVGISLMLGVFTRFGALLSVLLATQLYVGLAYAPGEWYWTYGMLVLLGLGVAMVPAGRRLGIDQWLALRLPASESRFARFLHWFV